LASNQTVLVTGATGRTVRLLREQNIPVRALVHQLDSRSKTLKRLGAEIVVGDLLDFNFVAKALKGVKAAYFIFPIIPGLIQATAYFSVAAASAGVEAIVNMSQISARVDSKSHAAQDHWVAERVFDKSGAAITHLRPTFFAEWFIYNPGMIKAGMVRFPLSKGHHAPIAAIDQSRFIAAILMNPAPHANKVYPLYGPVEMTHPQIAQAIGRALGKEVGYQPVSFDAWEKRAADAGRPLSPFLSQHLREVCIDYENGIFAGTNNVILKITGKGPLTIEEYVLQNRQAYE
jgi:uncharacterized protein YbjT (DUF2867 family)